MQYAPPLFFAWLRLLGGGALILLAAVVAGRTPPRGLRTHGLLFVGGLLNYTLFYAGLNSGVRVVSAGETAILNYTAPLWIAVFAHFMLAQPIGRQRAVGRFACDRSAAVPRRAGFAGKSRPARLAEPRQCIPKAALWLRKC